MGPVRSKVFEDVLAERERQIACAPGGDTDAFDRLNSKNDWISYVCGYAGRAADKMFRNAREGQGFRENMVKVAAVAIAALEAYDCGYMDPK